MTTHCHTVGAFVSGAPTSPRALCRHADLLAAYTDGLIADKGDEGEAYLSHFVFGSEMQTHFTANRNSVAGFAGPCWCRYLVIDIDRRDDLGSALADTRRLVRFIHNRYPEAEGSVPIWFSGSKGFNVAVELAHDPLPAVGFNAICRTLAEAIARNAGVVIDTAIYDTVHIIRLPNTRHPKTGLFKRRLDAEALFRLDIDGIRRHAAHSAGDGIPTVKTCPEQLAEDWTEAVAATTRTTEARTAARRDFAPDTRAPRYLVDLLRFGVAEGERHTMLFRSAAWLAEQGAPPSLVSALLTEPGCDVGLMPKEVERQIRCGIEHARRQRLADPRPDPTTDPDAFERWAIDHEDDPLLSGSMDTTIGGLALASSKGGQT